MILIDNIYVEESILTTSFCCDLTKCFGACCIEGESGAPLANDELEKIEQVFPIVKDYLTTQSKKTIEQTGLYLKDSDGDWTTPIIGKGGPCVFVIMDNNIAYCGIEKAFLDKKIKWQKPISCHLYPIRVEYKGAFIYLKYHQWSVCKPALKNNSIPMFRFLKSPIINAFGKTFYNKLEEIYKRKYSKNNS